eukprot:gene9050-6350_t
MDARQRGKVRKPQWPEGDSINQPSLLGCWKQFSFLKPAPRLNFFDGLTGPKGDNSPRDKDKREKKKDEIGIMPRGTSIIHPLSTDVPWKTTRTHREAQRKGNNYQMWE